MCVYSILLHFTSWFADSIHRLPLLINAKSLCTSVPTAWFTLLGHCSPLSAGKPPSPSWNVVYLHLPCAAMVPSQSLTMHANAAQESCIRHSDQPRGYETWWFYVHCQMRRIAMQTCCAVRCLYDFMSFAKHINHKSMLGTQGNVMKIIRYCKGRNVLTLGAFGSSQFMQQW